MPLKHAPLPDLRFVFQHGWGFSDACWREWLDLLARPCLVDNRGYWGSPCPIDCALTSPGFVLVCHSLGLHFLSPDLLARAGLLVVISGFAHFHGPMPIDGRFTRKHIKKMQSRLQSDPSGLIADFYGDCACSAWPVDTRAMNTDLLAQDLILLDQARMDERHFTGLSAVLLLHGREDRVVRPERADELAGLLSMSQLRIIDGAGHGLPFTHPRLCLDLIADFYRKMAVAPHPAYGHPLPEGDEKKLIHSFSPWEKVPRRGG